MSPAVLAAGFSAAVLLAAALRVHGACAWLVAAPFVILGRPDAGWRTSLAAGAAFGAGTGVVAHLGWVAETAGRYFAAPPSLAWSGAAALVIAVGVAQGALLGLGLRIALRARGVAGLLFAGGIWAAWDWGTLRLFPFYPWASLAAAQVDLPFALPAVAFAGQVGLTWATAAGGLAIGELATRVRGRRPALSIGAIGVALAAATFLATAPPHGAALCSIEPVDANLAAPAATLEPYLTATRARASRWREPPTVIAWPESSLPASPERDSRLLAELRAAAAELQTVLVAGGPRTGFDAAWSPRHFNSAYGVESDGGLQTYDKRRLVPFAEYWPLAPLPVPAPLATAPVAAGDEPGLFSVGSCRIGVLICFEAQRPDAARELAGRGADALLILSNDAALPAAARRMEIAQARLRAAETGLTVVRAANGGDSAWIGGAGEVVARGEAFRATIFAATR